MIIANTANSRRVTSTGVGLKNGSRQKSRVRKFVPNWSIRANTLGITNMNNETISIEVIIIYLSGETKDDIRTTIRVVTCHVTTVQIA